MKTKSKKEISFMREGGRKLAETVLELKKKSVVGKTTKYLDLLAREIISKKGGEPSFLGYRGFPAAICASVNNVVVHGIPSDYKLKEGDILSIDVGLKWRGYHTDMAITFSIGKVDSKTSELIKVTKKSLDLAVKETTGRNRLGDIGNAVESYVKKKGFVVVEGLCGHGIGKKLHQDPQILNTGKPNTGPKIKEGSVICIEPMVTIFNPAIENIPSGITTENLSAHFEHTVAVVKGRPEVLTSL